MIMRIEGGNRGGGGWTHRLKSRNAEAGIDSNDTSNGWWEERRNQSWCHTSSHSLDICVVISSLVSMRVLPSLVMSNVSLPLPLSISLYYLLVHSFSQKSNQWNRMNFDFFLWSKTETNVNLILSFPLSCLSSPDDHSDFHHDTASILYTAVVRGKVALPCDITPPTPDDSVALILWYKDDALTPIYTLDSRKGEREEYIPKKIASYHGYDDALMLMLRYDDDDSMRRMMINYLWLYSIHTIIHTGVEIKTNKARIEENTS